MNKYVSLFVLVILTACNGGVNPIDSQGFLSKLDGPKVPSFQDSLMESAAAAEKNNNFKLSAQLYQQILEKNPENAEIKLAFADSLRRSGATDQSIAVYDNILTADSKAISAKEGKALALITKGDFVTPVAMLDEVLAVDKTRWKTLNALGILFTTRNLYDESQQYFTEALKYSPDSPIVLNNKGLSQGLSQRYGTAINTLTRASSLSAPGSKERKRIDLNTALVFAITGRQEEAKALASTYLSGAELNNNLGLYANLANDDQMAKAYLNMALTDSKVFYEKAWDNLQSISGKSRVLESDLQTQPKVSPTPVITEPTSLNIAPAAKDTKPLIQRYVEPAEAPVKHEKPLIKRYVEPSESQIQPKKPDVVRFNETTQPQDNGQIDPINSLLEKASQKSVIR
jgi:Flp pilus assembly protein TadD